MTVGWPAEVDPDNLATVTCIEYAVYRQKIRVQTLADYYREKTDPDVQPLAELAETQIEQTWKTLTKITAVIEARRASN